MTTQTQTYRWTGKICDIEAQTAVECRFAQDVGEVLAQSASITLTGAEAGSGEVRYFGKAHFFLVYEDAEKRVCRAEKAVEFHAAAKDERAFSSHGVLACVTVENLSLKREGASVYLTALAGAKLSLYGEKAVEYLAGGELVLKREEVKVCGAHLVRGAAEAEDEFETELIGDILMHSETAGGVEVTCEAGSLRAEGDINLSILALKEEKTLLSFERLVPFRIEIPCDAASFGCGGQVRVNVLSAVIHAEADEEKGRCKISALLTLSVEGCVYEETTLDAVTDAFSKTCAVALDCVDVESETVHGGAQVSERIAGKAALSSPIDFSDALQAVTLQRAEANLVNGNDKRIEGVAMATLIVMGADGGHRGIEMSLPFSIPVDGEASGVCVLVCGMSARQRQEGEIDAEATLKITLFSERAERSKILSAAEEGEPIEESDAAVSVYIPRAGDGLWELAKSLNKTPEEVLANNPDVEFPVKEGQRVVIYRPKSLQA